MYICMYTYVYIYIYIYTYIARRRPTAAGQRPSHTILVYIGIVYDSNILYCNMIYYTDVHRQCSESLDVSYTQFAV